MDAPLLADLMAYSAQIACLAVLGGLLPALLRLDAAGATVRDLKVFGRLVPIHEEPRERWQHRGLGRRLMREAELLAREEFDARRIRVTAGVGVRGYYRRLGYGLERPYMVRAA